MYGMEESYVLFTLFGMDVTAYAFFLTLGVALGLVMALHRARRLHVKCDAVLTFAIAGIPLAVILGRAVFCLCRMVDVMDFGFSYIFRIDYGGFSLMGVAVGLLLAGVIAGLTSKEGFRRVMDCVVPGMLMALAAARFAEGSTTNGTGLEVMNSALQFFPIAVEGIYGDYRYAVFLGEGLTALVAAVWAQGQYFDKQGSKHPDGWTAAMGVIIVAAAQVMWESARRDEVLKWGFVRYTQIFAGAVLIILMIICTPKNGYKLSRKVITWAVFAACLGMCGFVEFLIDGKVIQEVPLWLCYTINTSCAAVSGALTAHAVNATLRRVERKA